MDSTSLIDFFKWCTIINFSILMSWSIIWPFLKDFAYNIHSKYWFSGTKEEFSQLIYRLFGNYKILIILFNLVPYIAICIITD